MREANLQLTGLSRVQNMFNPNERNAAGIESQGEDAVVEGAVVVLPVIIRKPYDPPSAGYDPLPFNTHPGQQTDEVPCCDGGVDGDCSHCAALTYG